MTKVYKYDILIIVKELRQQQNCFTKKLKKGAKTMKKYTQKELKNLVALGLAEDITRGDNETRKSETRKSIESVEGYYTQIGYSAGVYGCNGMLLQGRKTGKLYAITARTTAICVF